MSDQYQHFNCCVFEVNSLKFKALYPPVVHSLVLRCVQWLHFLWHPSLASVVALSHTALLLGIPTCADLGPAENSWKREGKINAAHLPWVLKKETHTAEGTCQGEAFPYVFLVRGVSRLRKLDVHSEWKLTRAALIYIVHTWDLLITTTSP